jgi:FkbM family methyltransferase
VFKAIYYWLLARLGIQRLRGHSFFGTLLAQPAVVVDFGAHRGEFFAGLKSEYSISRALLVEANPALAGSLKETFGSEAAIQHAALVGGNSNRSVLFTRSIEPESSSILVDWTAAWGVADQLNVPAVDLSTVIRELGGRVDLLKLDVEGAEVGVLETANPSDLASCGQFTVEFHDTRPPLTRRDVDRVCSRMRSEGFTILNANWPHFSDVLFVNLRTIPLRKRLEVRCRVALGNALFITRKVIFSRSA